MPIYEFTCQSCGMRFEQLFRRMGEEPTCPCPECGGEGYRQVSAPNFKFSHPTSQIRGPLPSSTGTSDDWNFDKTIGRDAEKKWEKINENQANKTKLLNEHRRKGMDVNSQHLIKQREDEGYKVMNETERQTINQRREIARAVNEANLQANKVKKPNPE